MFYYILDQITILANTDSKLQAVPDYLMNHYRNVVFGRADFASLVSNTPLAEIWREGVIMSKGHILNNISDIIRAILLWRFGGTYFDSDVISVKPIPKEHKASYLIDMYKRVN